MEDSAPPSPSSMTAGDQLSGLRNAIGRSGVSVLCQDTELKSVWAQNLPDIWARAATFGALDESFLPPAVAARTQAAKRDVVDALVGRHIEISIPDAGATRWFDLWIDPDLDVAGKVRGVVTTAIETTDHKRREQTLRALLREVSHRSKNLLAIIQSIASQTGRHSTTIDGFLTRFRGRLQSLAASQDLVTSSNWRGADLHDLLIGQVSRYTATPERSFRFEGVRPWLNPNATLHIGLALHELAINSLRFGALSKPNGVIDIAVAYAEHPPGERALSMTWAETVPASADDAERHKRFGSIALEKVVPASLGGTASLDRTGDSLSYRLIFPAANYEIA